MAALSKWNDLRHRLAAVRILIIHNSADIYGASRSVLRLCKHLDRSRFEPLVMLPESGPLQDLLTALGVRVLVFPGLRVITRPILKSPRLVPWLLGFLPSVLRLAARLRREEIALVHTNTGVICSSALAARLAGVPHLWHIRDWFQEFGALWKPYSRYILSLSSRVLCVSRPIAGQFPASQKIEVLHNGFALEDFPEISPEERAAARARWGFAEADIVACAVGRIKFLRKGQEFLLEAAALARRQGLSIKCLLAGGPAPGSEDQIDRMKALATTLGVEAVFTGELSDARPAYAAADIFVLPSAQPEPFGGVVMEAMVLGRPVIGTNIGGTPEQVAEGETGLLVPPSDPSAMAAALSRLAADPNLRSRMGAAGRKRIEKNFPLETMVHRIQNLYATLQ
ncbi:MAG: glycosyltransferase family 4 protein [Chthoniobacterales bacterium]|nr:glycosyltransferase family 4 protein [Chthoniobacterales bacterium]